MAFQTVRRAKNGFWWRIDRTALKPGDVFRFEYGDVVYVAMSSGGWMMRKFGDADMVAWDHSGCLRQ